MVHDYHSYVLHCIKIIIILIIIIIIIIIIILIIIIIIIKLETRNISERNRRFGASCAIIIIKMHRNVGFFHLYFSSLVFLNRFL